MSDTTVPEQPMGVPVMIQHAARALSMHVLPLKEKWLEDKMRAIAPPPIQRAIDHKWQDKVQKWMQRESLKLVESPVALATELYRGKERIGTFKVLFNDQTKQYFVEAL